MCMSTDERSVLMLSEEVKLGEGSSTATITTRNEGLSLIFRLLSHGKGVNLM